MNAVTQSAHGAASFEALMRKHNRRLYRVARSLLRNDAEAEDALQEAYICAYRALNDFRGEAQLATWLTRIVVNECMTRLRRSVRRDNIIPIVSASVSERRGRGCHGATSFARRHGHA